MKPPLSRAVPLKPSAGRRAMARARLGLPGRLARVTGYAPCEVLDVSQSGAGVFTADRPPTPGEGVTLYIQDVEAFGTVIWRSGPSFGVMFDAPLSHTQVVALRAAGDHFKAIEIEQNRRRARDFVQGRRVF